jgi:hypothetical protein
MEQFESEFGGAKPPPLHGPDAVSLVVLSNTYVELTLDSLRENLDQLYPGYFLPPREQGSFVVEGSVPEVEFLIKSDVPNAKGVFLLFAVPGPYTLFSNFIDHVADPVLRRLAEGQTCWLSVDLVGEVTTMQEAYRFIGSVLAHLAPSDSGALVHPSKLVTIAFDEEVRRRLASGGDIFGTS